MSHLPIAHFGHWYVQIAFAAPALVILAYVLVTSCRTRTRQRREQRNEPRQDKEGVR